MAADEMLNMKLRGNRRVGIVPLLVDRKNHFVELFDLSFAAGHFSSWVVEALASDVHILAQP